jgi:hypothetical protein
VREDVEREWGARLAAEEAKRKEADAWAAELARALEKEKKVCTVFSQAAILPSILSFFFSPRSHHPYNFASGLTSFVFFHRLICRHGSN